MLHTYLTPLHRHAERNCAGSQSPQVCFVLFLFHIKYKSLPNLMSLVILQSQMNFFSITQCDE